MLFPGSCEMLPDHHRLAGGGQEEDRYLLVWLGGSAGESGWLAVVAVAR